MILSFRDSHQNTNHILLTRLSTTVRRIHVECEWNVFPHDQTVGHSDTREDEVDGVAPHVLVGKNHNVDQVKKSSHSTNYQH